jgi:hypothetical protein
VYAMRVILRPYRSGGWEVDITIRLPDGSQYRERKRASRLSKSAALRWAEDRERYLLQHGPPTANKEVATLEAFAPRFVDGHARAMGFHDFDQYERLLTIARKRGTDAYLMVLAGGDAGLRLGGNHRARVARYRPDGAPSHRAAVRLVRSRDGAKRRAVSSPSHDATLDERVEGLSPAIGAVVCLHESTSAPGSSSATVDNLRVACQP